MKSNPARKRLYAVALAVAIPAVFAVQAADAQWAGGPPNGMGKMFGPCNGYGPAYGRGYDRPVSGYGIPGGGYGHPGMGHRGYGYGYGNPGAGYGHPMMGHPSMGFPGMAQSGGAIPGPEGGYGAPPSAALGTPYQR